MNHLFGRLRSPGAFGRLAAVALFSALVLTACGSSAPVTTAGPSRSSAPAATATLQSRVIGTDAPSVPPSPKASSNAQSGPVESPGSAFTLLRMATSADPTQPAPDARTFTSTFQTKAPVMYVVFALRPGLTGTVTCSISANGVESVAPITLTYGPKNSWGDFKITSRGAFVAGDYRATLTYGPSGAVAVIDFSVR